MITVIPKQEVLDALRKDFPKPPRAAENGLNKYCKVLGKMIFESIQRGQSPIERKLKHYSLSTSALTKNGGQIGSKCIRIHKWLTINKFELVEMLTRGNNLTGKISKVKLTKWAEIIDPIEFNISSATDDEVERSVEEYLTDDDNGNLLMFNYLYPELKQNRFNADALNLFDPLKVNISSLKSYIIWVNKATDNLRKSTKETYTRQAKIILSIALHNDGIYLQRKKPSFFGRMYYAGISAQSVNKELRKAMLGNCWEYDIRSSVIAWKMGYAKYYIKKNKPTSCVEKEFKTLLQYLNDKTTLMKAVQRKIFLHNSAVDNDLQLKLLKEAFTALSFGARLQTKGWLDRNGLWKNPAIVDIIKSPEERTRFINNTIVKNFNTEQKKIDDYLIKQVDLYGSEFLLNSKLQTNSGRKCRSKIIAFLYQDQETGVMNILRQEIQNTGRKILASIHDAIVINQRLAPERKLDMESYMQNATDNPYWRLGETEYKEYSYTPKYILEEEALHRQRIAEETLRAVGYKSQFNSV